MEYVGEAISPTPYLSPTFELPQQDWFYSLKSSISSLESIESPYIAFRQELISRRIEKRFGSVNSTISNWNTAHGDLHWSNVTNNSIIVDWESWGMGPRGIDLAFLYLFSILHESAINKLKQLFFDYFNDPQFDICLLFGCCELMRMTELHNDHPILYPHLDALGKDIFKKI